MYNIHSHYENIFAYLKTKLDYPVLLYFYPFGSINYENIEMMHCNGNGTSPVVLCFDQEPITPNFEILLKKLIENWSVHRHIIILNTEPESQIKNSILAKLKLQNFKLHDCSYFFHVFAAADWYRSYYFNLDITSPSSRTIKKKFITFNRITGNSRAYRGIFVADLAKRQLLEHGHVSFSTVCPEHGSYNESALELITKHDVNPDVVHESIRFIYSLNNNLRIDQVNETYISNGSQIIGCTDESMESFVNVVTETCFWESKQHLTEKIFKPIVTKQPFLLLGCAGNLQYLRSYGFKTFDYWWDESYDDIHDPIQRIHAVNDILEKICSYDNKRLESILAEMQPILDHNYNLFYSRQFVDNAWNELITKLDQIVDHVKLLTYLK
jgi:hypothetical protein